MLPEVTRFYAELGQNLALFAKFKALAASPEYATLTPRPPPHHRQRPARLPPLRRRTAGSAKAALPGNPGGTGRARRRSSPRTCSMPPTPTPSGSRTQPAWPAFPTTSSPRRVPRPRRMASRLEIHPARAVLPPGDAVRRRPRPARAHVSRLRHARIRAGQGRVGQRAADRPHPRLARRGSRHCSATPTTPRSRWCRRWPSTPAEVAAFLRELAAKARPFAERDMAELREFAAEGTRACRRSKAGTSPGPRKSSSRRATPSPTTR